MKTRQEVFCVALIAGLVLGSAADILLAGERRSRSKPTKKEIHSVDNKEKTKEKLEPIAKQDTIVVAEVNGTAVLREDLDRELGRMRQEMSRRGMPPMAIPPQMESQALESLIDQELLYQECTKKQIVMTDADVLKELELIKKNFSSDEAFKQALSVSNITEEKLKKQISKGMSIQKFVETEFVEKTMVSAKDVKDFYEKNQGMFKKPEQVKASHILIKVDPAASETDKAAARK
ncbi:MAG: SurA N-terminal domain-containing protein, partial [Candidatus Hydrogenedentes bacterium]|nr:SurA N-terminal domain-containing protein [Candidatus Hydrogenedentota bacterium]